MNQSEFLAITSNFLKAWEKLRVQGATGVRFASHWFKKWREIFKPITKRSRRNRVITFGSHLETAHTRASHDDGNDKKTPFEDKHLHHCDYFAMDE